MEAITTSDVYEPEMDMNRAVVEFDATPERWRRLLGAFDWMWRDRLVASPRRALDRQVQEFPFDD
jgi:hypothetical protein